MQRQRLSSAASQYSMRIPERWSDGPRRLHQVRRAAPKWEECVGVNDQSTLPVRSSAPLIPRDVVREIAIDIGKEVAAHIETMYPKAVEAATPTMLLSVRNCVFNQIMAALDVIDEDEIRARLEQRRKFRRALRAAYRHLREPPHAE